ncbi:MAG: helix-turn-helix transcriptional regulator [Lachnospiraceae bacterium]|nr:helix-turn-helix transcriptional regulator [Lachnospiraceae bacterium]
MNILPEDKLTGETAPVSESNLEFGKLLAKLRKEKGVLQKEVATYLNMTVATVSNYEKGVHLPDLNTLSMLADFFDVSTDFLLHRTDYKASISTLNKPLSNEYTVSDLMNTVIELDSRNTQALLDYYELLLLRNSIKRVK